MGCVAVIVVLPTHLEANEFRRSFAAAAVVVVVVVVCLITTYIKP